MMSFLNIFFTVTCILASNICFEIKTFYSSEESHYIIIGDKNNKCYGEKHVVPFDPNILKVNYISTIRDILINHIDDAKITDIDKNANIFVKIYYDPHQLKVKEVYFGFSHIDLLKILTVEQLQNIDKEVKEKVVGEKNLKRFGEGEIDDVLSKLIYLDGHGIGFKLDQLIKYKQGEISSEKLILL
jgi:hypothetical protein